MNPGTCQPSQGDKWKQMALIDGRLVGMEELADQAIDDVLVAIDSVPTPIRTDDEIDDESAIPNLVRFPITARTAGAR